MKKCQKCNRTYDDSQSFCLMDGAPLSIDIEEKTLVRQAPAPRKRKFLLWAGLLGLTILAGAILSFGFLIYKFSRQGDNTQAKRQSVVNTSKSPTLPAATPKSVPTSEPTNSLPVEESSPKTDESKSTSNDEDSEEITPIGWDTAASGFKSSEGLIYKFRCPAQGTEHTIWGSDIYTLDSSICTAAVHAGVITLAGGGVVTIELRPGRLIYGSTVRNGVKSNTYGEYPHSFVVR